MRRLSTKIRCHEFRYESLPLSTTVKIKRVKRLPTHKPADVVEKTVESMHNVNCDDNVCEGDMPSPVYNIAAREVKVHKAIRESMVFAENGEWKAAVDMFIESCYADDFTHDISVSPLTLALLMNAVGDLSKFKEQLDGFLISRIFRKRDRDIDLD
jgi:hypothetical protein